MLLNTIYAYKHTYNAIFNEISVKTVDILKLKGNQSTTIGCRETPILICWGVSYDVPNFLFHDKFDYKVKLQNFAFKKAWHSPNHRNIIQLPQFLPFVS